MVEIFEARTAYNCNVDVHRDPIESTWELPTKSADIGHLFWFEEDLLFQLKTTHPSDAYAKVFRLPSKVRVAIVEGEAWVLRDAQTKHVMDFALNGYEHHQGLVVVGMVNLVLVSQDDEYDIESYFDDDLRSIEVVDGKVVRNLAFIKTNDYPPISLERFVEPIADDAPLETGFGHRLRSFLSAIFRR